MPKPEDTAPSQNKTYLMRSTRTHLVGFHTFLSLLACGLLNFAATIAVSVIRTGRLVIAVVPQPSPIGHRRSPSCRAGRRWMNSVPFCVAADNCYELPLQPWCRRRRHLCCRHRYKSDTTRLRPEFPVVQHVSSRRKSFTHRIKTSK